MFLRVSDLIKYLTEVTEISEYFTLLFFSKIWHDVRKYAKRIFQVWLQHPDLERILARYLSDGQQRDMAKLLESIQNEVSLCHIH